MFIKSILYSLVLLIIKLYHIKCNYDIYRNQFSIYFNRAFDRYNKGKESNDNIINHLLYNQIFTKVNIGQTSSPIYLFLTFNHSEINIILPNYLNSIAYNKESIKNNVLLMTNKIKFPKTEILLNLTFNLEIKENDNETLSYLGLNIQNNNKNSFINQLKQNNIIIKKLFSILYKDYSLTADTEFEGQILFGLLPHEMSSRYNEKDLYWASIINGNNNINNNSNDINWKIKFDSVYYNEDNESLNTKIAEFDISLNLIIGPEEYRQKILKNYFEKFISAKLCKEEIFYNPKDGQFYYSYACEIQYDIEDFPTLSFYNKDLNETFIMNYQQLLCVFKNKVYLKVVFKKNVENQKWILGRGFMEFFPLIFDVDNKKIGYYKTQLSENHPTIVFIFFTIVISIFGIYFYKGLKYEKEQNKELVKRKKDDNYLEEKNNKENNPENANKKNIKKENLDNNNVKEVRDIDEKTKLLNNDEIKEN